MGGAFWSAGYVDVQCVKTHALVGTHSRIHVHSEHFSICVILKNKQKLEGERRGMLWFRRTLQGPSSLFDIVTPGPSDLWGTFFTLSHETPRRTYLFPTAIQTPANKPVEQSVAKSLLHYRGSGGSESLRTSPGSVSSSKTRSPRGTMGRNWEGYKGTSLVGMQVSASVIIEWGLMGKLTGKVSWVLTLLMFVFII